MSEEEYIRKSENGGKKYVWWWNWKSSFVLFDFWR
jgi:hypothetical protein